MSKRRPKGGGTVYRRGIIWWIAYAWGGRRYSESTGTTKKGIATDLLNRRLGEIGQGKLVGPREEKVTVADILHLVRRDYEIKRRASLSTVGGHFKAWKQALGPERARNVNYARLQEVVRRWQQEGGVRDSTINRRLAFLQRAYRLANRTELLSHMPDFPHLEEHNVRQVTWERSEYLAVRERLPDDHLRDLLDWLWWTGMRIGQAIKLRWSSFSLQRWELRSPATDVKTRTEEVIPLAGTPLQAIIERRWEARKRHPGCPYIFHRDGKKIGSFRRSFRTACLAAGIIPGRAGKTIHDFRRTGVANLIDSGCDERTAMLVSGHKTLSMLARYNIRRREAVRQALQQVEEYVEAMPTVGTVELLKPPRERL
jgi:integrase